MARRVPARFALSPGSARRTSYAMSLALIVCLASSSSPLTAQERARTAPLDEQPWARQATIRPDLGPTPSPFVGPRLAEVERRSLFAKEMGGIPQPAQPAPSRDTLKNGAIIGAVAGAVGLGALGALICHLYREEGGASCLPDTLRVAAIGAGVGLGAGVVVDAALSRNAGVRVRLAVSF